MTKSVLALGVLLAATVAYAADHFDAPTIKMAANSMADINDVYAWMTSDAASINLAMTVSPADDGTRSFTPSVQYVFHVTSYPGPTNASASMAPGTGTNVICTFASNTSAQCWVAVGTMIKDYVKGDPSKVAGVRSASGKVKLFAGQRSDPFFFNLGGFLATQATVESLCTAGNCPAGLGPNAAGCPAGVSTDNAKLLRDTLSTAQSVVRGPCPANQIDCFANLNVMSIVLQLDKSLLLDGTDHLFSVWGSTHATP